MKDQAPARRGGVEGLAQGPESDAAAAKPGHDRDEVLQGAAEPIQRRHHQGVTGAEVVEALGEFLALDVLAGLLVGEDLLASGLAQGEQLAVEVLALGGDAAVADERAASADRIERVTVEDERGRTGEGVGHGP